MDAIVVPGELGSLGEVAEYVAQACSAAGVGRREAYRLRLAVDEIVTNIIVHGYGESGVDGTVRVAVQEGEGTLTVLLEDTSPPFDPRDAPRPDLSAALEDRPIGGLGVHLALQGVDEVDWCHLDGRNVHRLTVQRDASVRTEA